MPSSVIKARLRARDEQGQFLDSEELKTRLRGMLQREIEVVRQTVPLRQRMKGFRTDMLEPVYHGEGAQETLEQEITVYWGEDEPTETI